MPGGYERERWRKEGERERRKREEERRERERERISKSLFPQAFSFSTRGGPPLVFGQKNEKKILSPLGGELYKKERQVGHLLGWATSCFCKKLKMDHERLGAKD